MDGRTLRQIEIGIAEVDRRRQPQLRAGRAGERVACGRRGRRHIPDRYPGHRARDGIDGDHPVMIGVGDEQAAVREHIDPSGLIDGLAQVECPQRTLLPDSQQGVEGVGDRDRAVAERAHTERVLEAGTAPIAVGRPPLEEPLAGERLHSPVAEDTQRRDLGVGEGERAVRKQRQPARLREVRRAGRAVPQALGSAARDRRGRTACIGHGEDAMRACLGDGDASILEPHAVPRRAESGGEDCALAARERDRDHLARDRVADDEALTAEAHSLRLVEAVEHMPDVSPKIGHEDAIIPGVGDRDAVAAVGRDLAGKSESGCGGDPHRGERGAGGEVGAAVQQLLDHAAERGPVALARGHRHHVAVRVDHDQRWPRSHAVLLPGLHLRVVEHRMPDPVARDRPRDRRVVGLVRELR